MKLSKIALLTLAVEVSSLSSIRTSTSRQHGQMMKMRHRSKKLQQNEKDKSKCEICPEPQLDLDMDRREATFAMIGQLWATTATVGALTASPEEASAVFGEDANIEFPNMLEGMNNRVNRQCLVESLGNRECLAYLDESKKIYQGADASILIERLEKASEALADIPSLASEKKWSKVIGILTGPMGTLGQTMDKLSKMSDNEEQLCALEKQVKTDLYAIAAAADKKSVDQVLKLHEKATKDLVTYAKALN